MNVLSLFDGMSCGQIALERAGIPIDRYYASEIDKYAIKVTQANYPDTIQLGDIRFIKARDLPKIDLLIGGSPCQGFSFAGKQLNFDDPRSALFFEYARLLKEVQPTYFLLENVRMKKESQDVITNMLGVEPIMIDSALVSAQQRKRLYWTNIPNVTQPDDKHNVLFDVLENRSRLGVVGDRYYVMQSNYRYHDRAEQVLLCCEYTKINKTRSSMQYRVYSINGKSRSLLAGDNGNLVIDFNSNNVDDWRILDPNDYEVLQTVPDNYTNHVSKTQRYKMLGNGWTVDVIAHILKNIM